MTYNSNDARSSSIATYDVISTLVASLTIFFFSIFFFENLRKKRGDPNIVKKDNEKETDPEENKNEEKTKVEALSKRDLLRK